jgi:hypothetical protein
MRNRNELEVRSILPASADSIDVPVVPSRTWSQDSDSDEERASLLGLSLRVCNPANALESVYHVLDVLEGSPAEMAGELMIRRQR